MIDSHQYKRKNKNKNKTKKDLYFSLNDQLACQSIFLMMWYRDFVIWRLTTQKQVMMVRGRINVRVTDKVRDRHRE